MKKYAPFLIGLIVLLAMVMPACGPANPDRKAAGDSLTGELIIFHAGSLSVPGKALCDTFRHDHPGVKFITEAAGSKECARKITDLNKPCDVMMSADFAVIDQLLIPDHASWNIHFASNEMCIVYTDKSRYAADINANNWFDVLLKKDVAFGRSDPDSDPCGVRAVLTSKLAERYYAKPGLAGRLLAKDRNYMRPKETDLLALLESGAVDYIFLYRSVALQHQLKYLLLPDEINLKNPAFDSLYAQVQLETLGKKPGETITEKGASMVYGLTIPAAAPNPALAESFVAFVLSDRGQAILEAQGQPSVVPAPTATFEKVPAALKKFAQPKK